MAGRRGLITGVANARSIAWGIAQAAHAQGARLILTYQSERLRSGVEALASQVDALDVLPLDVSDDASLQAAALRIGGVTDALDFVLHGTAFAQREELSGRFVDVSRAGFATALDVSAYALVALARAFGPLLRQGVHPSLLTLTYLGAERAMPNYNVMGVAKAALEACVRYLAADLGPEGIRVNAISAGPIRTLSAAAIPGLRSMLQHVAQVAPLRRNVLLDDVGDAALFALSALGRGMTGEIVHVDGGYNVLGAPGLSPPPPQEPAAPF
jgi:enoyl-[acyl-carrier protein] reductase I